MEKSIFTSRGYLHWRGALFRGYDVLLVTHPLTHTHVQVNDKTEVGLTTTYNFQTSNVSLGLAGKYTLEDGAQMKVRETRLGFHLAPCEVVTYVTHMMSIFTSFIRKSNEALRSKTRNEQRLSRVILNLGMFSEVMYNRFTEDTHL